MRVAIVGAGPSGLVTCKSLLEAATPEFPFDPVILEQEGSLGGTFRFRSYEVCSFAFCESRGRIDCAQNANLVSSKQLTCFSDFRLPAEHSDHLSLEVRNDPQASVPHC